MDQDKNVFLVSGSDYGKTLEQVGQEVLESVNRIVQFIWECRVYSRSRILSKRMEPPRKTFKYVKFVIG